ncbi:MAG: ABC transporter substrate binding protein [Burkholderiaceae bacterium]
MRSIVMALSVVLAWLAPPAAAQAQTQAVKRVLLITNRGCEEVCQSFRRNLESQGPVEFVWRDAGGDTGRVAAFVAEARELRPDLIATWGTGITLAVVGPWDGADPARHVADIPVVYMYVGDPVASKIARSAERSGRQNVAGANTSVPLEAQIRLLQSYRKLDRIGMLYNTDEPAAVTQAREARRLFEAHAVTVDEERLPNRDGRPDAAAIPAALDRLARHQPDFLYYVGSTFTLKQIGTLADGAIARGIPMFSATEPAFRQGDVLLGLVSPLAGIGQVAAHQAGQILFHRKQPGELESPALTRHSVLINMRAARALKIYPPMKLLQFAELTD